MKNSWIYLTVGTITATAVAGLVALTSCVTRNRSVADVEEFKQALETAAVEAGPRNREAEKEGIARFKKLFGDMDPETAGALAREAYAPGAWFSDTLVVLKGNEEIADYLQETAENAPGTSAQVEEVSTRNGNYYLRWTMDIRSPNLRSGETLRSTGITMLRFDSDGRILIHKDYWDSAAGLYDHLPVIGPQLELIRKQF